MNTPPHLHRAPSTAEQKGTRMYRGLLVLPFVWQVGAVPLVNDMAWSPWGLPFPMLWQMAGVVFASLIFAWVFRLDRQSGIEAEEQAFLTQLKREGADT